MHVFSLLKYTLTHAQPQLLKFQENKATIYVKRNGTHICFGMFSMKKLSGDSVFLIHDLHFTQMLEAKLMQHLVPSYVEMIKILFDQLYVYNSIVYKSIRIRVIYT